jgi:hypothetical protein
METIQGFIEPSLADRVINLSKELSDSKDELSIVTQQLEAANKRATTWQNSHIRLSNYIDGVADTIKEAIINDNIDKDTLIEIARQLNIELTREVRVKFIVTFEGTVGLPLDFDTMTLVDQFTFEVSEGYNSDIEFSDFNVDDVEVEVRDV